MDRIPHSLHGLSENFTQHVFIIFFPIPQILQDPPHPDLPTFMFSLKIKIKMSFNKAHGVWFVSSIYSWEQGLPWSVAGVPSATPLKETDLAWYCSWVPEWSCANTFSVRGQTLRSLPSFMLLIWSNAHHWNLWVHVWICPHVSGTCCFLKTVHHLWPSQSSYPFSI